MNQLSKNYNLAHRTSRFGLSVIKLCRTIPLDTITKPIVSQLIRSSTSIGANCAEAVGASSKKDFANKIFICRKEAQETRHWLVMIFEAAKLPSGVLEPLQNECHELILIFQKINTTLINNTRVKQVED
jgi:four helix bundle protein